MFTDVSLFKPRNEQSSQGPSVLPRGDSVNDSADQGALHYCGERFSFWLCHSLFTFTAMATAFTALHLNDDALDVQCEMRYGFGLLMGVTALSGLSSAAFCFSPEKSARSVLAVGCFLNLALQSAPNYRMIQSDERNDMDYDTICLWDKQSQTDFGVLTALAFAAAHVSYYRFYYDEFDHTPPPEQEALLRPPLNNDVKVQVTVTDRGYPAISA